MVEASTIISSKENSKKSICGVKFIPFIPGLPSQDTLRLILEYLIGPDDRHVLYKLAYSLCKRSIVLIQH